MFTASSCLTAWRHAFFQRNIRRRRPIYSAICLASLIIEWHCTSEVNIGLHSVQWYRTAILNLPKCKTVFSLQLDLYFAPYDCQGRPGSHRRTQDFTMEGVQVVGDWARGSEGQSPPEAEAKCEISVQFLTFSCIKFWT